MSGPCLSVAVVDGPMEGLAARVTSNAVHVGRGTDCGLVLPLDPWVSRTHMRFEVVDGQIFAVDEGGRNGTWLASGRIGERVPLAEGDVIVIGRTPVQVGFAPAPPDRRSDLDRTEPPETLRAVLDDAASAAQATGRGFVDTAAALAATLRAEGTNVTDLLVGSSIDPWAVSDLAQQRWIDDRAWVGPMVDEAAANYSAGPQRETPAVLAAIDRATKIADQRNDNEAGAVHLLIALFEDPAGPVADVAAATGITGGIVRGWTRAGEPAQTVGPPPIAPETVMPDETRRPGAETGTGTAPPAAAPRTQPVRAAEPAPALFELESWDVFSQAKEIGDRIRAVQATYHLADPDQRRQAIEEVLSEAFTGVVPERRDKLLAHLAALFPITDDPAAKSPEEDEIERLSAEVDRLRAALAERTDAPAPAPVSDRLAARLLEPASDADGNEVRVLRAVARFAMDVERFVSSVVQSFQSRTADLTRYVIPPFRKDLKDLLSASAAAEDGGAEALESYLSTVRQWLIASIVGYNRAASETARDLLARLDPRAIEQGADLPRWRDAMGMSDAELWRRFKELYADLEPDLVDDRVQEQAGKLAAREVENLKGSSKNGRG